MGPNRSGDVWEQLGPIQNELSCLLGHLDLFFLKPAAFFQPFWRFLSVGAEWGRGGRGPKISLFVQRMSGNNWGPFLSPGAAPVKSYLRLPAKIGDLTKMGSQAWG
jgi:hypothetical protein